MWQFWCLIPQSLPKNPLSSFICCLLNLTNNIFIRRKNASKKTDHDHDEEIEDDKDKKDKKLVFLSRSVLQKVRERPMVTGTQIANEILEMYK